MPLGALSSPGDTSLRIVRKTVTFDGSATGGAVGTVPVFAITGRALIAWLTCFCTTSLVSAGGGTVALGIPLSTGRLLAATTATALTSTTADHWTGTSPSGGGLIVPSALTNFATRQAISITVATADVTGGVLVFECYYRPLSADGALT